MIGYKLTIKQRLKFVSSIFSLIICYIHLVNHIANIFTRTKSNGKLQRLNVFFRLKFVFLYYIISLNINNTKSVISVVVNGFYESSQLRDWDYDFLIFRVTAELVRVRIH